MNCFRKITLLLVSLLLSASLRAAGAESAAPVINPTPHSLTLQEGTVDVSGGVRIIDRQEASAGTRRPSGWNSTSIPGRP